MNFTVEELQFILEMIRLQFGPGYSDEVAVARLQAKLSIHLEVANKQNWHSETLPTGPKDEA